MHSEFLWVEQDPFKAYRYLQFVGESIVKKLYFFRLSVLSIFELGHIVEAIVTYLHNIIELSIRKCSCDLNYLWTVLVISRFTYNSDRNSIFEGRVFGGTNYDGSDLGKFIIGLHKDFVGGRFDQLYCLRWRMQVDLGNLNLRGRVACHENGIGQSQIRSR